MAAKERKLGRSFYARGAEELAEAMVGTVLAHRVEGTILRARVVETEAYVGPQDLASHASKGRTRRTDVMFGPPGHAYVYFIYGMYEMFNVVCGGEGDAQAVLVRAGEPLDGWEADLSGPGKLARAMKITRADNGLDLTADELFFARGEGARPRVVRTRRVGVDYAKEWRDKPLRFLDAESPAVSKPKWREAGAR